MQTQSKSAVVNVLFCSPSLLLSPPPLSPTEHVYMVPGDQVYYDETGMAIPLATTDTYAPLTSVTKLEGERLHHHECM